MPVDKLSIQDFAKKIKTKYPQYKDINDTLLTQKIVDKYPEYKSMVNYQVGSSPAPTTQEPEHQINHTSLHDIRHLDELANAPQQEPDKQPALDEAGIPVDNDINNQQAQFKEKYDQSVKDLSAKMEVDPKDLNAVIKDFPDENDETKISQHLQLKKENPETYNRFKAADANVRSLAKKSISDANRYNQLQGSEDEPITNLDKLERNIYEQKEIILSNLSGTDRAKALANLEQNRSASFNATNPEVQNAYANNEELKNTLNVMQYAGLMHLKAFDPEKAELYSRILKPMDNESDITVQMKIGREKALKELLDIGRNNTEKFLNEKQFDLDKYYKSVDTQEEKDEILKEFLYNKNIWDSIKEDEGKDESRFPYLKDLEFERQARELSGDPSKGVVNYTLSKFGKGIGNAVKSIQNQETHLLGTDQDIAANELQRLGESAQEENEFYLPESDKPVASPFLYKFDKPLQDAATAIKNDKSLSDEQRSAKLIDLVKNNQDQVHTVSNTENFGKSANFFSKATLYKNAGMMGDLASIAVQQAGMNEAGVAKFLTNTIPMYLSTQNEFYKQALEEGRSNPMEYANVHSAIMMAAGAVNPDLGIAKRALGNTTLGKAISGISEKTWNETIAGNKALLNRIKNSAMGAAKEGAKIGLVYGAGTSIANDLADKGFFNKNIDAGDILSNAVKATKESVIGSVALLGLHGITNYKTASPEEKARIWELGHNTNIANEEIDEAVKKGDISSDVGKQRKDVIKTVSKLIDNVPIEDSKGRSLTDQQRANYLYNLLLKRKIEEIKTDLPDSQKEKLDAIQLATDIENNAILDPKTERENLMQRKRELTAELEPDEEGKSNLTPLEKKTRQDELDEINNKIDSLDNPKKPSVSVIMPENVKKPETITIKPQEDAIQQPKTDEVLQREPKETGISGGERERVESSQQGDESARISTEEEDKSKGQVDEDWPFVEEPSDNEITGIRNKITQQKIQEYGLTPALKEAKRAFPQVWDEAVKKINKGYDPQHLVDQLKKKPRPITDTEDAILLYHQAIKESELESINKQINESYDKGTVEDFHELNARKAKVLDELQDLYDVDKKVGTANARGLNARKMIVNRKFSLVNMMTEKRASEGGRPLTEEEKSDIEKKYNELKETNAKIEQRVAELEKENESLKNKATAEPEEVKEGNAKKQKKDYKAERKEILKDIREKLLKAAKGQGGLKSSIPLLPQLEAIAPDVIKLVRNLVNSGVDKLHDVTQAVLSELKGDIPELTENHVYDLIAGEFKAAIKEKELTPEQQKRKQLAEKRAAIKKQAKEARYLVTDPELLKLRADYERQKASWGDNLRRAELAQRSRGEKLREGFIKWERAFKLSGITTLAKLLTAGATRLVSTPVEEGVGAIYSAVLPKNVVNRATGEGGLNIRAEARAIKDGLMRGIKDSGDIMRKSTRGQSDIEAVFGKGNELPPEAIGFFGQLHSAIKAPVKRAAFERSLQKRLEANIRNGVDVSDPMVQTKVAVQAYKDAQRAIFMQDNLLVEAYKRAINSLEKGKHSNAGTKILATGLQWMIPFVKVPTNIIGEVQRHVTGIGEGALRLGYQAVKNKQNVEEELQSNALVKSFQAMKNGLKNVSEEEADAILRAFKKGSVGAGALLLGYFNPNNFGGYYQKGEKKTKDKLKPGSAKALGVTIPIWLLESPLFQTMQLGATVRKLHEAKLSHEPKNLALAFASAELDLAGHEPLVEGPEKIMNMIKDPKEREYFMGELAKGSVIPAGVSNVAQFTDPAESRKPTTILEHIETGIPGLRETVPTKKKKKRK